MKKIYLLIGIILCFASSFQEAKSIACCLETVVTHHVNEDCCLEIDITSLSPGMYTLVIWTDGHIEHEGVLVQIQ